ncbi:MAG TPA: hypothetical protein VHP36_07825 [Chitinispirillaceae bacterium]|nr:hypothetical protein [Chitinispirillaceae bacterium]
MSKPFHRTISFIRGDYISVLRDSMMGILFISPVLIGLAIRILLPYLQEILDRFFNFDLTCYFTGISGFLIQLPPLLYGLVAGFIIIDERDEGVLQYLTVTPLSRGGYLAYRIIMPSLASIAASVLCLAISAIVPVFFFKLLPVLILSSLGSPLIALLLAAYAHDKIAALPLTKLISLSLLPALVVFFCDSPLQFICGITPAFWIVKAIVSLYRNDPFYLVYTFGGLFMTTIYMFILYRIFSRKVL